MRKQSGFTLLELAISIAIIALLIAAISVGRDIQRTATLRSVLTDIDKYGVMKDTFKVRFGQLPGDFDNAYSYWGSTCNATESTCNGNNDGLIPESGEHWMFWRHMQLADLMERPLLTGVTSSGSKVGINIPKSNWKDAGYGVLKTADYMLLRVGTNDSPSVSACNAVFTPEEVYFLDVKADDGLANNGYMTGMYGCSNSIGDCRTSATSTVTTYVLSSSNVACQFWTYDQPL